MASGDAVGSGPPSAVQAAPQIGVSPQGVHQGGEGVFVSYAESDPERKRFQVSKACTNCAVAHLSCDEVKPCRRCVKKGLECEDRVRKRRYSRPRSSNRYEDSDDGFEPKRRGRGRPPGSKRKSHKEVEPEDEEEYSPENSEGKIDNFTPKDQYLGVSSQPHPTHHTWSGGGVLAANTDPKIETHMLDSLLLAAALAESQAPTGEKKVSLQQPTGIPPFASMNLLPSIPQAMQGMAPSVLGPMNHAGVTDPNQFQFYMMQLQMQMPLIIQWRFLGQPRPVPLALPLAASVVDLFMAVLNQLHRESLINASDRIALTLTINGISYPVDDKVHALVPLMSLGIADPTALLDVSKISR